MEQQGDTDQNGIELPKRSGGSGKRIAIGLLVGIPAAVGSIVIIAGAVALLGPKNEPAKATAVQAPAPPAVPPAVAEERPVLNEAEQRAQEFMARSATIQSFTGEQLVGALWAFEQTADSSVTYAMLERNAERFRGRNVVFSGKILEIHESSDGSAFMRLGLGEYGEHALAVMAPVPPHESIVANSRARVYGMLSGSYTYQSQAGWTITIPQIVSVAVVPSTVPRRPGRGVVE